MKKKTKKKKFRLTQAVSCAGCAAKLSPTLLREAVFGMKQPLNTNLLVGFDKADDAGVYQLNLDLALVQTVDFFTPIVDDPTWYGRIAAANALSDVYAMGGKPLTALNIFCFPEELGAPLMRQILQGGLEKIIEARCTLVGGHSVKDSEIKYGLSVTGLIDPQRIFSNDRALPGHSLVLTKKLGTGIITTAAKWEDCPKGILDEAIETMATLNVKACEEMLKTRATSCTDITGFGFLGHLSEMARASRVNIRIDAHAVPFYDGLFELIDQDYITRGDVTNRKYAGPVKFKKVSSQLQKIFFDPQTSGGLLISMPPEDVAAFQRRMKQYGQETWVVGQVLMGNERGLIEVIG